MDYRLKIQLFKLMTLVNQMNATTDEERENYERIMSELGSIIAGKDLASMPDGSTYILDDSNEVDWGDVTDDNKFVHERIHDEPIEYPSRIEVRFDYESSKAIADFFGYFHQRDMLTEECAEVIQAVNKCRRGIDNAQSNLIEELGDLKVMLSQMEYFLGEGTINDIANKKMQRAINKIAEEKEAKNCG